ncbi:UNVERIFIED_CONTAM: AAHS family benzoate transporter-like MFS transporter [Brevibacillus sp. OAP136]
MSKELENALSTQPSLHDQTQGQSALGTKKSTNTITSLVILFCWLTIFSEGYDLGIYGAVLPALMKSEWALTPAAAGAIGSYALIGMLIGSITVGAITDMIGRKKVLIFCLSLFSITMGLAAMSTTPELFAIFRFIGGLGIGGVIPSVSALTVEYSPPHRRQLNYVIMNTGYATGAIFGSLAAVFFLEQVGWRFMFWLGVTPLLIIPFFVKYLPESIGFLLVKNRKAEAEVLATRYQLSLESIEQVTQGNLQNEKGRWEGVKKLFLAKRNAQATLAFSIIFFLTFLTIYGLNTWLPKLMQQAGYPLSSSLVFLLVFNLTAVAGSLVGGAFADRFTAKKVIGLAFLLAAISICLLSFKPASMVTLYCLIGLAGVGSVGTTGLLSGYATSYFGSEIRATAVGTVVGLGRIGAALGPVLGGIMLSLNIQLQWSFYIFALAAVMGAITLFFIPRTQR